MSNSLKRIELLKKRDPKAIRDVYKEYRHGFLLFAKRYSLDDDRVLDIYQDAVIALCENAEKGTIDNLRGSLKTYLFSIGKYMIFSELRKNKKTVEFDAIENFTFEWETYSEEKENAETQLIKNALAQMGEKCQEILKLFYYEERNLDEITTMMGYDNKDVAKSQKSRCLRQLRSIIGKYPLDY